MNKQYYSFEVEKKFLKLKKNEKFREYKEYVEWYEECETRIFHTFFLFFVPSSILKCTILFFGDNFYPL